MRRPIPFAAKTFVALTIVVILFQLALVAGAPWGDLTMGGAFPGRLPPHMRIAALCSALLLAWFGVIVAARAGMAFPVISAFGSSDPLAPRTGRHHLRSLLHTLPVANG